MVVSLSYRDIKLKTVLKYLMTDKLYHEWVHVYPILHNLEAFW